MRRADLIGGLALLAFAALYFQQSFAIRMGFAGDRLGPAAFPRLLAVVLAVAAIALIVRAVRGRSEPAPPPPMRQGLFLAALALIVGYTLTLPFLGFLVATPLLLGSLIWLLGLRMWPRVIGVAVGLTVVLYVAFDRGLHVLLPPGLLGR